jgi:hypothetical protein
MSDRDDRGRWLPGASPNPGGRPRGIVRDAVRRALEEAEQDEAGTERTRAERLVRRMLSIAFAGSDRDSIRAIAWLAEQSDGRLPLSIAAEHDEKSEGITIVFREVEPANGQAAAG